MQRDAGSEQQGVSSGTGGPGSVTGVLRTRRSFGRLAARVLAAGLLASFGCGDSGPSQRVLLVSVDTLRADHVGGPQRHPEATMPFVDGLLERGVRFSHAWTPIPRTTQALASLLTGLYPHRTRVRTLVDRLPPDVESVAEMAQRKGYRTIAVVSNHMLTRERGLDRGFDVYDSAGDIRGADATTAAALAAVAGIGRDTPLFLWVHYIDPHVPYHPPRELAERFDPDYRGPYRHYFGPVPGAVGNHAYPRDLGKRRAVFANPLSDQVNEHIRSLYAADVRFTDSAIEALLAGLEDRLGRDWLVVFTADHGESLGEHDYFYDHGDYVYAGTTRVPLGIVLPGGARRTVADPVSLVDVTPTLVELLGLAPAAEGAFEGRSLVPYLRGEELPPRPVFAESGRSYFPQMIPERVSFDVPGRFRTVVDGSWKLIWTPGREADAAYRLFDLAADPDETRDLSADHPERVQELRRELARWTAGDVGQPPPAISEPDEAALRALGYIEE
jgi:arylsulfatase A-like enzyme